MTNEDRSVLEIEEFQRDPPENYLLYIRESEKLAVNWLGNKLGDVYFGREYRANFGGKRVPVTVRAINGFTYSGTWYKSAGDYARVKRLKKG
jgi:hypothetical protein